MTLPFPDEHFKYVKLDDDYVEFTRNKKSIAVIGQSKAGTEMTAQKEIAYLVNEDKPVDEELFAKMKETDVRFSEHMKKVLRSKEELVALFDESFGDVYEIFSKKKCVTYFLEMDSVSMSGIFETIRFLDIDYIYMHNLYFEELSWNKIYEIHDFLEQKREEGKVIPVCLLATRELTNESFHLNILSEKIRDMEIPFEEEYGSFGSLFSVIANQEKTGLGAAKYIEKIMESVPPESPAGKWIDLELEQEYSEQDASRMHEAGIVCFTKKENVGTILFNSTMAVQKKNSIYKNISNLMILSYMMNEIKQTEELLVGYPSIEEAAAIGAEEIKRILENMKSLGMIRSHDYFIDYENIPGGEINMQIEIVPIFSIEKITQYTQVRVRV